MDFYLFLWLELFLWAGCVVWFMLRQREIIMQVSPIFGLRSSHYIAIDVLGDYNTSCWRMECFINYTNNKQEHFSRMSTTIILSFIRSPFVTLFSYCTSREKQAIWLVLYLSLALDDFVSILLHCSTAIDSWN